MFVGVKYVHDASAELGDVGKFEPLQDACRDLSNRARLLPPLATAVEYLHSRSALLYLLSRVLRPSACYHNEEVIVRIQQLRRTSLIPAVCLTLTEISKALTDCGVTSTAQLRRT